MKDCKEIHVGQSTPKANIYVAGYSVTIKQSGSIYISFHDDPKNPIDLFIEPNLRVNVYSGGNLVAGKLEPFED